MAEGLDGVITLRVDVERDRLVAELGEVSDQLAALRLELDDAEARFRGFAALHDRTLAPLYADLDEVRAEIAALLAERSGLESDYEDAARARERADRSARAAEQVTDGGADGGADGAVLDQLATDRPPPSDEARELFRALIKRCHPDLAADDDERDRREGFTRSVNEAYANGDSERLEQLSFQWDLGGAGSTGAIGTATDLAASIETGRAELAKIRAELEALKATGLGRLLFGSDEPATRIQSVAQRVVEEIERQSTVLQRLRATK